MLRYLKDGLTALMIAVGGTKIVGAWRQFDKTACFTPSINYAMRTVAATTVDFVNVVNQLLASGTNININAQVDNGRE